MRKTAKRYWVLGLGLVAAVTMVGITAAYSDEVEVTLDQVPAAVKATILREAAGAKITEIEKETHDGKTVYEAEFLRGGKEVEIKIAPDGSLLGQKAEHEDDDEDDIAFDQLPKPAQNALRQLAGGAKILEAEREKEHGVVVYEAEWVANGTKHEAAVLADGTLIETEEIIPVEALPASVRAVVAKHFPAKAKLTVEKKMVVVYEIEARIDGKEKELIVLPTGHVHGEHGDGHDDDDHDHHRDDDGHGHDHDDDDHGRHHDDDDHGHEHGDHD